MTSTTSTTSPASQPGELYFTRKTKRAARIGNVLRVVTEGATITISLGEITRVAVVVTEPGVVVSKSVRKAARTTENKQASAASAPERSPAGAPLPPKPAARKMATTVKQAVAKPAARKVATTIKPAPAKPAARKVATTIKPAPAK